jgi:hypothetical protein
MTTPSAAAAYPGEPTHPVALPWPPDLPDGLPRRPRVLQLTDADAVSHGLVDGTPRERASNHEMRSCLGLVHATATAIDPHPRVRCAASTRTATCHLDILTASGGNTWVIRRGVDGADYALLEELADLIDARTTATRPGRKRPARLADMLILVGQDEIYTRPVRQLRVLGVPTWLLVPGYFVAASLYRAATAVSFIGPRRGA